MTERDSVPRELSYEERASVRYIIQENFREKLPFPSFVYNEEPTLTISHAFNDNFSQTVATVRELYIPGYESEEQKIFTGGLKWVRTYPWLLEEAVNKYHVEKALPGLVSMNFMTLCFPYVFSIENEDSQKDPLRVAFEGKDLKTDVRASTLHEFEKFKYMPYEDYSVPIDMNRKSTTRSLKVLTEFFLVRWYKT